MAQEHGNNLDLRLAVFLQVGTGFLDPGRLSDILRQVLVVHEKQLELFNLLSVARNFVPVIDFGLRGKGDGGRGLLRIRVSM